MQHVETTLPSHRRYRCTATLACSGGDEQPTTSSSASAATSTKPPTSTSVPATAAPPTAAPSPDPAEAALAAAIKLVDGVAEADCTTNNPQQKDCVSLDPNHRAQASRGIAASLRLSAFPGGRTLFWRNHGPSDGGGILWISSASLPSTRGRAMPVLIDPPRCRWRRAGDCALA